MIDCLTLNLRPPPFVFLSLSLSTEEYSISWNYPRSERNIRYRQRLIKTKLNKIYQQIQNHSRKYALCFNVTDKLFMNQLMHIINDMLRNMIKNDLQNLYQYLEQKKILIGYDAYDIYLLQRFFEFNPTEYQVKCFFSFVCIMICLFFLDISIEFRKQVFK